MIGRPRSVSDDEIFRALTNVVARLGPARLTVAAVAKEANLSGPSLLQRFASKQGLLAAYAANETEAVAAQFRAVRQADSQLNALFRALEGLTRGVSARGSMANNLAFLFLASNDPDLRKHAVAQHRSLQHEIAASLDAAIAEGELAAVDSAALSAIVHDAYLGALSTWAIDGKGTLANWVRARVDRSLETYRVGRAVDAGNSVDTTSHSRGPARSGRG